MPRPAAILPAMLVLALAASLRAESESQTVLATGLYTGGGEAAVAAGQLETREIALPDGRHTVARLVPGFPQWGFVTAWFGLPTPAGRATVRVRAYVEAGATAAINAYTANNQGQVLVGTVALPADARPGEMATIDIPLQSAAEWGGFVLKKAEAGDRPGPWIESLTVILP